MPSELPFKRGAVATWSNAYHSTPPRGELHLAGATANHFRPLHSKATELQAKAALAERSHVSRRDVRDPDCGMGAQPPAHCGYLRRADGAAIAVVWTRLSGRPQAIICESSGVARMGSDA